MNLRDLDAAGTAAALAGFGIDEPLARRIFAHVHRPGGADTLDGVVGLSRARADAIAAVAEWPGLACVERRRAADGFVKYLFRLPDGPLIEAVRIPLPDPAAARAAKARRREARPRGGDLDTPPAPLEALPPAKYTVCVSSQAGCALACGFCATGRLGGIRSLRTWEILAQIRHVAADADHPVRGVVFMGMGEPFLNYDYVIRAARILSHPAGFAIAGKAITISTAGVVPAIRRFTAERHPFRLIVSLGAPTHEQRARLMPIENRWPLPELMDAVGEYARATGERTTFAYVLIGGDDGNTSPEHARRIAALLAPLRARLTLIDVTDDPPGVAATGAAAPPAFRPPTDGERNLFLDELAAHGIPFVRRYSGGGDIGAACGLLAGTRTGGVVLARVSR